MFPDISEQMGVIRRGVVDLIPEEDLIRKLSRSRELDAPLTIKLGCDPSRPDLHLGHTVVLRKMRQFQDLGHQAVLIVGDFTGMIGDPTGRNIARPSLTLDETREHGMTYFEQASKVLDPKRLRIVYNSEWLGKMSFEDVIRLSSKYTVARMLEREDFRNRYSSGKPISIHELLYPLAQAMDSVAIKSDVELGGTDQRFNLLLGRDIQQEYGQEPQIILTMPILPGTDGIQKMGKSLNNYVGISESSKNIYGKVLSIPDDAILGYFELLTDLPEGEIDKIRKQMSDPSTNPRDLKRRLAREIVALYHSGQEAISAEREFDEIFIHRGTPDDMLHFTPMGGIGHISIVQLIFDTGIVRTKSEARRLVQEGGVSVDNMRVLDVNMEVDLSRTCILKCGKRRFVRIVPRQS